MTLPVGRDTRGVPMKRLIEISSMVALAALVVAPSAARAGALVLPGFGPQAQARAGAFTAKADDPSALFHNPAGFAKQTGTVVHIGFFFLDFALTYRRAGVYEATGENLPYEGERYPEVSDQSTPAINLGPYQVLPYIGVSTDFGLDLPVRFGFGIYPPHAYPDRDFTPDYEFEADPNEPPPPQRYDIMEQRAVLAMPSVAAAYSVTDDLDLGLRLSWGFGKAKASAYLWGIRNYEEWIANDGYVEVDTTDWFMPGFGLGALYRPSSSWELALAYDSGVSLAGKGWGSAILGSALGLPGQPEHVVPVPDEYTACGTGGTDQDHLRACAYLNLPQTATVGARWILRDRDGNERADLELDVKWEDWSETADVKVVIDGQSALTGFVLNEAYLRHGYRDVFSFRLGGSYRTALSDAWLVWRGGVAYDTAAAPLSYARLDQDGARRGVLSTGVAYETDKFRVELGGGVALEPERDVAECNPTVAEPGCPPGSGDSPQADRRSPDPLQPLVGPNNQIESPFNAGVYRSHYILFSLGFAYFY